MKIFRFVLAVLLFSLSVNVLAQPASEAEIEARAKEIGRSLRCVVCQNQSIDESDAPLAADMRTLVRERLRAGDSNVQITQFMRERYGDFVLLKPPLQRNTYILWFAPAAVLGGVFIWYGLRSRRKRAGSAFTPLSSAAQKRFDALMDEDKKIR